MKSMTKRKGTVIAAAALAGALAVTGTLLLKDGVQTVSAEEKNEGLTYFYEKLGDDTHAKSFYNAFDKLYKDGVFKTGKLEYNLIANGTVTGSDVSAYVNNGNTRLPKAFGAGRDSFIMDHPDLFYIDVFGTSISAGMQGNAYAAYLDSSRVKTLYLGGLDSAEKVNAAVTEYENKLAEIVAEAKAAGDTKAQIEYVNKYICENTEYSFGTEIRGDKNVDTPAAAYINTAYGSIVNGKAICGGYSKGFKAVMDRLGIPCVCVQGYSLKESGSQAHMWNVVKVDGNWYNVDVTWNDTENDAEKWMLLGSENFDYAHQEDKVISSSGYEFDYPAVSPYDYGNDSDQNGMRIDGEYQDTDSGKLLTLTINYENKGAPALQEEGKYLAYRSGVTSDGEIVWGPWVNAIALGEVYASPWAFGETDNKLVVYASEQYLQFALINRAPDESFGAFYPDEDKFGENAGKEYYYAYKADELTEEDFIVAPSVPYENEGHGSYVPAPWGNPVPANTSPYPIDATYNITITYTESLELIEPDKGVEMSFTTGRGDSTVREHAVVSDLKWDNNKVISFKFTPSKMYIHNSTNYYFVPTNLMGKKSKKVPSPVIYSFKYKSVVCSKVFNDGRLYMNVIGQASLLDTSDLSITDFRDENGNYYAESQRSQLMLVASKPDTSKEQEMKDVLLDETPIKQNDIVASETFEIDLQICGVVSKVPNGSYMQVAFGFPEGYDPDDAGTTFKIYHYKHDDKGNITGVEEIPVIVTEYGLIARVHSFSPFTIVQVKNTSAAVAESKQAIYATASGNGSVTTADGKSGIAILEGDSIVYTVKADEGYQVSCVFLNGKAVEASKYANGTLTLSANELEANNTLEVRFVTKESAKSYEEKGMQVIEVTSTIGDVADKPEEKPDDSSQPEEKPDDSSQSEEKPTEEKKSGCGSSIGFGAFGLAALAAVALGTVVIVSKRKNNG